MVISDITALSHLRACRAPDALQRIALGQALLAIKHGCLYRKYGFDRFESFLDSPECPFGHTISRYGMKLAERTDLHGLLYLGIGRLTELMRLSPGQVALLLREGTPTGPVAIQSVRSLRRHVHQLLGSQRSVAEITGVAGALEEPDRLDALVESWTGSLRERLLSTLLTKQLGQDLARVKLLLDSSARPTLAIEPFWPDTRRGIPQRWVALTAHLERLEQRPGAEPTAVASLIQRLGRPLEAWERAVFYLDLCRRDPERIDRFRQLGSAVGAIEKILAGSDRHYNDDQIFLAAQMARGRQSRPPLQRPFWRRLFREVSPPQEYRALLGSLEAAVEAGQWQIHCTDIYQANYLLQCLRSRQAQLFWQIAAAHLGAQAIQLLWSEGGQGRERTVRLTAAAA